MTSSLTPVRTGLDGLNLAIPRGTGVATYTRALSHCLAGLGHEVDVLYGLDIDPGADPRLREVQFFDLLETERGRKGPPYPSIAWVREMLHAYRSFEAQEIALTGQVEAAPFTQRLGRFQRILNVRDMFNIAGRYFRNFGRFLPVRIPDPPALMHWTYPVPIQLVGAKNIYTIHDVVPLRMPYTTLDNKAYYFKLLGACTARADHIVTVSETSRRDIMGFFPKLAPGRITNTFQSITPPARVPTADEIHNTLTGAFNLEPGRYFLFCGSIEPKKNVGRLLQAYLAAGLDLPLVIIGARAWKSENELALLKHRPDNDRRVRQIDYVPAETLSILMRGARALVFPSLYEGFGLPMLEAMALGTPVLTSREGSLPEIGGEAALYIDPYDCQDIAAGLQRLASDDALCQDLAVRGLAQAAFYDMDAYRSRITALYQSVLHPPANAAPR